MFVSADAKGRLLRLEDCLCRVCRDGELAGTLRPCEESRDFVSNCRGLRRSWGFPGGPSGNECTANAGDIRDVGLISGSGYILWSRKWQPTLVFLPRQSFGQRSLLGDSP